MKILKMLFAHENQLTLDFCTDVNLNEKFSKRSHELLNINLFIDLSKYMTSFYISYSLSLFFILLELV